MQGGQLGRPCCVVGARRGTAVLRVVQHAVVSCAEREFGVASDGSVSFSHDEVKAAGLKGRGHESRLPLATLTGASPSRHSPAIAFW